MAKTSCKKGQYYCNTDKKCKPIPDGYKVREDGFLVSEGSNPRIPRKAGQPAKSKKHSDLYTDEDPKGTIHGLGFKDVATAKASVAKIRKSSRSHAHKIQAAIAMEQRARVMGKTAEAAIYRKFINSMKKKTKKMNEAVSPAQQAAIAINMKKEGKKPKIMKEGSLHKWFKGSKSKDGKGGWVNVVTGGTCASDEPGEGTPKCVSSAKRASMSKKERLSAARRKKKADPGQQQKRGAAKPTYVSTDKPKKKKKMKEEFISLPLQLEVPQSDGEFKLGMMFRESLEQDRGMLFIFENTDYHSFHMKNTFIPLDIAFINEEGIIESIKELDPMNPIPVYPDGEIRYAVEVNRGWFAENGVEVGDILLEDIEETEIDLNEVKDKKGKGSGTKDACYHKVKSRYSVWPSAYASGALVKCRKVGAANWGNSSKKEEVEYADGLTEGKAKLVQLALKFGGKAIKSGAKAVGGKGGKGGKALKTVIGKGGGKNLPAKVNKKAFLPAPYKKPLPPAATYSSTSKTGVDLYKGGSKKAVAGMEIASKNKIDPGAVKKGTKLPPSSGEGATTFIPKSKLGQTLGKAGDKATKFAKDAENTGRYMKTALTANADKVAKRAAKVGAIGATGYALGRSDEKDAQNKKKKDTGTKESKPDTGAKESKPIKALDSAKKISGVSKEEYYDWRSTLDEKCWKGYEKKGMKTMFGKRYPNCVKKTKKEELEVEASSLDEKVKVKKTEKNPANMALPKGVKSPVDYRGLYSSNEMEGELTEKTMTSAQKRKDTMLKKKYDDSDMKKNMIAQYGKEEGTKIYFAKIRKEAMKEDVLDEGAQAVLRPLVKGASYFIRKVAKSRNKLVKKGLAPTMMKMPNIKKSDLSQYAMYHGTTTKSADKIMKSGKFKKSIGDVFNSDGSMYTGKRAFATTDPKRAKFYAKLKSKYSGGKPEVLAVKVRDSKIDLASGGGGPNEFYVKTKAMKPVGRGVKPIKIKKGEVMQNSFNPLEENTAIESELVIQDWNVDDINYTEVEAVDIIKPEPLKPSPSNWREDLGEDWQKVNRKDKTDGMSKAAVKAYRRENPGSKLKTAVTKDPKKLKKGSKSAKRRLAFCRRMRGMKKKLTSAKTSRDPDSRINKALRRWNC